MMNRAEKLRDFVGYEPYEDDTYDTYETYDARPAKPSRHARRREVYAEPAAAPAPSMQISLMKLESADDARYAIQQLAQGGAVLFSLAGTPRALSRRLLDFVCGGLYAYDGWVEHVAIDTYLLLPQGIEVLYG